MSWLRFFRRPQPAQAVREERTEPGPFLLRRFDAAQTDRLNRDHWRHAHGQSINSDLATDLESVMARSAHEYANNPFYHGVVSTYALHVVGPRGPSLQVHSDDAEFNEAVERAWREVWRMPDPAGRLSGVDGLKVLVKQICVAGSSLVVFKRRRTDGPLDFGWQTLHPRRLVTPVANAGDPLFQFGIEFDRDGRRIAYHFDEYEGLPGIRTTTGVETRRVPASVVQHVFVDEEAEQATGYPKLAAALGPAAAMREYDREVLEAARNAAKHAVGLEAQSPEHVIDPDPIPAGTTLPLEAGVTNVAPMGWRWAPFASTQPMTNYPDFRRERLMELGRPLHMPLMLVLLSSHNSNFSSAQFDGTIYAEGIADFQGMIERQHLDGCVEQVIADLVIDQQVERPSEFYLEWSWPVPPHANIEKVTKALRMQFEDGAISLVDYCAKLGMDYERVQRSRRRVAEELDAWGLPPAPANTGGSGAPTADDGDAENEPQPAEASTETAGVASA